MAETPYVETELLLAVMNEDDERAHRLVEDMLPGERRALSAQLDVVDDYLRHICDVCGHYVPRGEPWVYTPQDRISILHRPLSPGGRRRAVYHREHAPRDEPRVVARCVTCGGTAVADGRPAVITHTADCPERRS